MNGCGLVLATLLAMNGASAIDVLRQQVQQQPERLDLWLQLSWKQEQAGLLEDATRSAERALALADVYDTRIRLGWLQLQAGHCDRAIEHYRAAAAHAPESLDAWLGLQRCQTETGDFAAARKSGERLLALNPDNPWGLRRQAYVLFMLADYEAAEQLYRRVLADRPDDGEMLLGLGFTRWRRSDPEGARELCQRAAGSLESDPRVQECLAATEPVGMVFSASIHGAFLRYSGVSNHQDVGSTSLATAVAFPSGFELIAGAMLVRSTSVLTSGDYFQFNPVLGAGLRTPAFSLGILGTLLLGDKSLFSGVPVITATASRTVGWLDLQLAASGSWYSDLSVYQLDPGIRIHLPGRVDLEVGGELIAIPIRTQGNTPNGRWGSSSQELLTYWSGRLAVRWTISGNWAVDAGGFGGWRRFAVDDGGWSVWNNDDRYVAGYHAGVTLSFATRWSARAEFRHLFGDQQEGLSADFQLAGGVIGIGCWF